MLLYSVVHFHHTFQQDYRMQKVYLLVGQQDPLDELVMAVAPIKDKDSSLFEEKSSLYELLIFW